VFFSASQDIAFDAYKIDIAKPSERGLTAAASNLGYRVSAWLAFAFALVLADSFGWRIAMLFLAATMLVLSIATWFAPEPQYHNAVPRTLRESVVMPLKELMGTPGAAALILLVMLFKVGDAFALKLFTPFLMDVGFSKTEIALVAKAVFTTTAIAGGIVGGIWMVKLGLFRSMLIFGALQALSNLLYYMLAVTGKNYAMMIAAVAVDNFAGAMGNVASVALMMSLCDIRYSAFQYALLSALALLPRYGLGGPAGWIADHGGWHTYYIVSFFIALPGMLLVWLLRDRVRALDVG
jgi:PAT family beta-lactamase induction signal transducer AmpG